MLRITFTVAFFYIKVWSDICFLRIQSASQTASCDSRNVTELDPVRDMISWADSAQYCTEYWYWVFMDSFSQDMGIVMEIHDLYISDNDTLMIFDTTEIKRSSPAREYNYRSFDMAPVLLNSNQAVIFVNTSSRSGRKGYSRFFFGLSLHPKNATPPTVNVIRDPIYVESFYTYDCSSVPDVPQVLHCDKVRQCVGGEDEHHCDYQQPGCGDWLPYKDHCLKFFFNFKPSSKMGFLYPSTPSIAEKFCEEMYQASLVQIPEDEDKLFVEEWMKRSGFRTIVVGLRKVRTISKRTRRLYRYLWQWGGAGGPIAYGEPHLQRDGIDQGCAFFNRSSFPRILPIVCMYGSLIDGHVCSRRNPLRQHPSSKSHKPLTLSPVVKTVDSFSTKICADNSVVQIFHPCPSLTIFTGGKFIEGKRENITQILSNSSVVSFARHSYLDLPLFQCRYGNGIPYSLTCDGSNDCVDASDEVECDHPKHSVFFKTTFVCRKIQLIPSYMRCNGFSDCLDESDEEDCSSCKNQQFCGQHGCVPYSYAQLIKTCPVAHLIGLNFYMIPAPFAQVTLDGYGMFRLELLSDQNMCPETHFQCPAGYCIPTFLLNNGEQDCPQREDENTPPEKLMCPGFYRCYSEFNCVHPVYICDGIPHCPFKDDELFCELRCPAGCTCQGYAYRCNVMFNVYQHLQVRYLDLSNVNDPTLVDLGLMEYLHFLNISSCQLHNVTLKGLRYLRVLDLSNNYFSNLTSVGLENLERLQYLDLSNNPLVQHMDSAFYAFMNTAGVRRLETLVVMNTTMKHLYEGVFDFLHDLISLDVRDNRIDGFDTNVFQGLNNLRVLKTDSSKLCCSLPQSSMSRCEAPVDELSSCDDLLGSDFFRVFLWIMSLLAIMGNVGVFFYRLIVERSTTKGGQSFPVLVHNLSMSDCLMGVYLMLIGVADTRYRGIYFTQDWLWRDSVTCWVAGFLAFLSSEVSALVLCLITADRILVVCFPLHKHLHFNRTSSILACAVTWGVGVFLATIPLLPSTSHWRFYSQTGICLPLPSTRQEFPGQHYTFSVFIVLNFILFLTVGVGQMMIFRAIRKASAAAGSQREQQEMAIARRLFLVAFSDFCCWFPIGIMGLLTAGGVPISGKMNVWAAVFVLPVNSALNPFLYTMNGLLDKWNRRREDQKTQRMLKRLHGEIDRWSEDKVEALVQYCFRRKLAGRDITLLTKGETNSCNKMTDYDLESS